MTRHLKKHLPENHRRENWLRDIILGGQDGLVNVLGIVLGVSAASGDTKIIIAASLAASFAEAISMGAVAYTSTLSEKDRYEKELERERKEIELTPEKEKAEIHHIYASKGFSGKLLDEIVTKITAEKQVWLETMMDEEMGLKPINTSSLLKSSMIVGLAALIGALIPIFPFFFFHQSAATPISLILSAATLFSIGFYEAKTYVGVPWKHGFQMLSIGMGAALAGFLIGKVFNVTNP